MDPGLTLIRLLHFGALQTAPPRLAAQSRLGPVRPVRHGFVPLSTLDKWFVACNHGTVSFYRSGNGVLVYRVSFVYQERAFKAREALVNDDPTQITPLPAGYEACFSTTWWMSSCWAEKDPFPYPRTQTPPSHPL